MYESGVHDVDSIGMAQQHWLARARGVEWRGRGSFAQKEKKFHPIIVQRKSSPQSPQSRTDHFW